MAEFLLAIAQRPHGASKQPTRWVTFAKVSFAQPLQPPPPPPTPPHPTPPPHTHTLIFAAAAHVTSQMCQVGSGFTDVDRAYLYEKLAGNTCERPPPCYKYGYCTKQSGLLACLHCAVIFLSPFCCFDAGSQTTTRNVLTFGKRQKLCTDVPSDSQAEALCWPPAYPACPSACTCRIRDPLKSVVLEVHADLRLVRSKVGFLSGPFLFCCCSSSCSLTYQALLAPGSRCTPVTTACASHALIASGARLAHHV